MKQYKKIYNIVYQINKGFSYIAIAAVLFVAILTTVDVILRLISRTSSELNMYVNGMYELTQMLMILMIFLAYGVTEFNNGHVGVNIFTSKLKPTARRILKLITDIIMFAFLIILIYSCILQNQAHISGSLTTSVLFLSYTPFTLAMTLGVVLFAIAMLFKIMNDVISIKRKDDAWADYLIKDTIPKDEEAEDNNVPKAAESE